MKRSIQYNYSILLPSTQVTLVLHKNIPLAKRYMVNSVRTQASVNKWKIQFSLLKVFVSASERASTGMCEYIAWQGGKKANRKKSDCKYASVLQQRVSVLEPTWWPAPGFLVSSVNRALHRYRRGHGFKSRTGLNFIQTIFSNLLKYCS